MEKQKFTKPYKWSVVFVGAALCCFSAINLAASDIDWRLLLLGLMTVIISSRLAVQIPFNPGCAFFRESIRIKLAIYLFILGRAEPRSMNS